MSERTAEITGRQVEALALVASCCGGVDCGCHVTAPDVEF